MNPSTNSNKFKFTPQTSSSSSSSSSISKKNSSSSTTEYLDDHSTNNDDIIMNNNSNNNSIDLGKSVSFATHAQGKYSTVGSSTVPLSTTSSLASSSSIPMTVSPITATHSNINNTISSNAEYHSTSIPRNNPGNSSLRNTPLLSSASKSIVREISEPRSISLSRSVLGTNTINTTSNNNNITVTEDNLLNTLSSEERKEAETLSVYEYAQKRLLRAKTTELTSLPLPLFKRITRIANTDNIHTNTNVNSSLSTTNSSSMPKPLRSFGLSALRAQQQQTNAVDGPPLRLLHQWETILKDINQKNSQSEMILKMKQEQILQQQKQTLIHSELEKQMINFTSNQEELLNQTISIRHNWDTLRIQKLRKERKQRILSNTSSTTTNSNLPNNHNINNTSSLIHLTSNLDILQKNSKKLAIRLKYNIQGNPEYEVRELQLTDNDTLQSGEIMVFAPPSGQELYSLLNKYVENSEKIAHMDSETAINLMQKIPYIEASNEEIKHPGSLAANTNPEVQTVQEARTTAGESRHTALIWSLIRALWGRTPNECQQEPGNRMNIVLGSHTNGLQYGSSSGTTTEKRSYDNMDIMDTTTTTNQQRTSSSTSKTNTAILQESILKTIRNMLEDNYLITTANNTVLNNNYNELQHRLHRRELFSQWLQNTLAYHHSRGYVTSGTGSGNLLHLHNNYPAYFSSPLTTVRPLPLPYPINLSSLQIHPDYTYKQVYEGILSAIARRDLQQAKELAFAISHPMLGLLLSSAGTDAVGRIALQNQLQQWRENISSSTTPISKTLYGIYSILAGEPWDETIYSNHRTWLECLGLCHWYNCESDQSLDMTIQYYIRSISLGVASVPLPWYTGTDASFMKHIPGINENNASTHGINTAHPFITAPNISRTEELSIYAEYAGIDKHHTEKISQLQVDEVLQLHTQHNLPNIHQYITNTVDAPLIMNAYKTTTKGTNNEINIPQIDKVPSSFHVEFIPDEEQKRWSVQAPRDTLYRLLQFSTINDENITNDYITLRNQLLSPLGHTMNPEEGCLPFHLLYILNSLGSVNHQYQLQKEQEKDKEFINILVQNSLQQLYQEYEINKQNNPLMQHPLVSNGNYDYLLDPILQQSITSLLYRKYYDMFPHKSIISTPQEILEWARIYAEQLENNDAWHYAIVIYQCAAGLLANRLLPTSVDHPRLPNNPTIVERNQYNLEIETISESIRQCLALANNLVHVYVPKPKVILQAATNYSSKYNNNTSNTSITISNNPETSILMPVTLPTLTSNRLVDGYEYLQRIEWLMHESNIPNIWFVHAFAASAAGVSSLWGTKQQFDEEQLGKDLLLQQQRQERGEDNIDNSNLHNDDSRLYSPPLAHQLSAQLAIPTLYYLSKLSTDEALVIDGLYKFPNEYGATLTGFPRIKVWSIATFRAVIERDILPRFLLHHLETVDLVNSTNKAYQTTHTPYVNSLLFPNGLCCGTVLMDEFGNSNTSTNKIKVSVHYPGIINHVAWNYQQLYNVLQYILSYGMIDVYNGYYLSKVIMDGYFTYFMKIKQNQNTLKLQEDITMMDSHEQNNTTTDADYLGSEQIIDIGNFRVTNILNEDNGYSDPKYWPPCPEDKEQMEDEPYPDNLWPLTTEKRKYYRAFLLALIDVHRKALQ